VTLVICRFDKTELVLQLVKKFIVAILAFLYVSIASGVMVNIHYCMGDLASVEYGTDGTEACGKCGMKEKKGCCHTEYKFVKLQDAHQLVKTTVEFNQLPAELPVFAVNNDIFLKEQSHLSLNYHSPPDPRVNEVYLHNRVFRI